MGGHGYVTKCNGRDFYYARYVDWAITTPIMLIDIVKVGGGSELTIIFLVLMDIFMIVSGLIGELIEGSEKWAFFGFSMFAFMPIMWVLCTMAGILDSSDGLIPSSTRDLFRRIAAITLISWMGYPLIWILASVGGASSHCGYQAAAYGQEATQQAGYRAAPSRCLRLPGRCHLCPGRSLRIHCPRHHCQDPHGLGYRLLRRRRACASLRPLP